MLTEDEAREKWPIVAGPRYGHSKGYVRVRAPNHPNAAADGWVYEHVYVASRLLGRGLAPDETAHHVYGETADNRNLLICTVAYHRQLHARLEAAPEWPQFTNAGAGDNRPHCTVCDAPIPYASASGLCLTHYWETYPDRLPQCRVEGCKEVAGKRSGLCLPHLKYRANKQRYRKDWDFPCR